MAVVIGFGLIAVLAIFQSAVLSQMPLLHGTPNLIMLVIVAWAIQERTKLIWVWAVIAGVVSGLTTALPFGIVLGTYLAGVLLATTIRRRFLRTSMFSMVIAVILNTLVEQAMSAAVVILRGASLPLGTVLNLITLPSILLNIIFSIPMYVFIKDLSDWLYPSELEI